MRFKGDPDRIGCQDCRHPSESIECSATAGWPWPIDARSRNRRGRTERVACCGGVGRVIYTRITLRIAASTTASIVVCSTQPCKIVGPRAPLTKCLRVRRGRAGARAASGPYRRPTASLIPAGRGDAESLAGVAELHRDRIEREIACEVVIDRRAPAKGPRPTGECASSRNALEVDQEVMKRRRHVARAPRAKTVIARRELQLLGADAVRVGGARSCGRTSSIRMTFLGGRPVLHIWNGRATRGAPAAITRIKGARSPRKTDDPRG